MAVDALTGPPVRLDAVNVRLLVPALMAPAVSVFASVRLMPVGAVAVTTPPKSLVAFVSVIDPVVEVRLLVPVTVSGAVWVTLPADVSVRLPAVLAASVVEELSTRVTEPVVFTATVPKFAVPWVSEIAPPPVAVSVALPPMLSKSVDWSTNVMLVPVKVASPVTVWLVPASVMAPVDAKTRLPAVFVPVIAIAESSEMETAPAEL